MKLKEENKSGGADLEEKSQTRKSRDKNQCLIIALGFCYASIVMAIVVVFVVVFFAVNIVVFIVIVLIYNESSSIWRE